MSQTFSVHVPGQEAPVTVATGQSILDAALRANVWLPHSCTQGTCGTCKIRVTGGTVSHNNSPECTLTHVERVEGFALGCMATPTSDLTIETVRAVDTTITHHPLRDYRGTLVGLDDIAVDTRRLIVELDQDMLFHAGQYCEFIVPGTGAARQYSMANPPSESRRLEFHIKRTPGGQATDGWIFGALKVGDLISLRGPLGQFHLVAARDEAVVLIGGGTGLAPLKSIVRHALDHALVPELYLYHGGRRYCDLYDVEYFQTLATDHSNFHYRPALSEEAWDGATGLVTDVVGSDLTSCRGMSAYLCGPPAMVGAAMKVLKRRRMSPRLIFREEFTPSITPWPGVS